MSFAPIDDFAAPPESPPLESKTGGGFSRKGSVAVSRKGSVAVGGKKAAGKGKKAAAIPGLGADMRRNKAFLMMRQVRTKKVLLIYCDPGTRNQPRLFDP